MRQVYPYQEDMELELLGMMILKEGEIVPQVAAILEEEDFSSYEHQLIFRAIVELYNEGTPPNMPTIADWLKRKNYIFKGENDTVSPYDKVRVETIMTLGQAAFTTAYAESYAWKLKEASNRDKLYRLGMNLQKKSLDLTKDLIELLTSTEKEFREISEKTKQKKLVTANSYFSNKVLKELNKSRKYANRKTGFKNIDSAQIFTPGLYVIGATPAAGKTTFCWQLLKQIADNGEFCIYCSYEMSSLELFTKTLSRELFKRNRRTQMTSAEIRRGSYTEELESLIIEYASLQNRKDINLLELRDENIDELLRMLRPYCKGQSPVVCVDYLQIVPPSVEMQTDKARIDDIVHKLKTFQRETNTTFIVISSFNRMNYYQQVSFESFKESGNIEYTADVVWALQLNVTNDIKIGATISETRQKVEEAKRHQPRNIQLKCLKNRQGQNYDCFFHYYSAHDFFEESEEE